jgi:L-asparaginase II
MKVGEGKIVCKRGAEGYQIVGLMPGALGPDSPGVGIAFKVSDGDASRMSLDLEARNRVRPAVTLEILRQLGVISSKQGQALESCGPVNSIQKNSGNPTGQSRAAFELTIHPL